MRLIELEENPNFNCDGFWFNPLTNSFLETTVDHTNEVYENPKFFGLTRKDLPKNRNQVFDARILKKVGDLGWVRGGKENWHSRPGAQKKNIFYFQTNNIDALVKTVAHIDKMIPIDLAHIDTEVSDDKSFEIDGYKEYNAKEIKFIIKNRRLPKVQYRRERIWESISEPNFRYSGYWFNPYTNGFIVANDDHTEEVYNDPESFGLSIRDMPYNRNKVYDTEIMKMVCELGWVRGGKGYNFTTRLTDNTFYLQSNKPEAVIKTIVAINKEIPIDSAYIDFSIEDQYSYRWDEYQKYDYKAIEYIVKYRRFPNQQALKSMSMSESTLKEYKIHKTPKVPVIENPTSLQLKNMLDQNEVRALIDVDNKLFIWPAFYYIHDEIKRMLGLKSYIHIQLETDKTDQESKYFFTILDIRKAKLLLTPNSENWKRAIQGLNVQPSSVY